MDQWGGREGAQSLGIHSVSGTRPSCACRDDASKESAGELSRDSEMGSSRWREAAFV